MNIRKVSYGEAVQYLYSLQKYGIKFGLSKTSHLLNALGNPHHSQNYIHIAGSNGKGSVGAMVESILVKSGLKVGFYSSPHLVRFTERFRVNKNDIPPTTAAGIISELMDIIHHDHPPTFFEVTTAMALAYFKREETDISIMEVGMGGRLDATNVITPLVSVITNIALEHQFFLGPCLTDIAREKAGVIKRDVDLVTAATQRPVLKLFEAICDKRKTRLLRVGKDFRFRMVQGRFNYYGPRLRLKNLELGLKGRFQDRNAALTLAVIEILEGKGFKISPAAIKEGLRDVSWPGRMHIISKEPFIVLDGAHNPRAISALVNSLDRCFTYERLILIVGVMGDKDIEKIIHGIVPIADYVIYTRPEYYRSASPESLMITAAGLEKRGEVAPTIPAAIERAREIAGSQDLVLITGSLFTVGEALTYFDPVKYRKDDI